MSFRARFPLLLCVIGASLLFLLFTEPFVGGRVPGSESIHKFATGYYTLTVNGLWNNTQVSASPDAGACLAYGKITTGAPCPVWRFVPAEYNGVKSTWIFRTDTTPPCNLTPPIPFPTPKSCECWTSSDGTNFTAYWNTDTHARWPPQDYEMFDFIDTGDPGHFAIRNTRVSQSLYKFMVLNSGVLTLVEDVPGTTMVTVAVNPASPPAK